MVVIIGILSGMMMLSVGSATDKAEATKIVNALRNYKSASIMYYMDHAVWPTGTNDWADSLDYYIDRSLDRSAFSKVEVMQLSMEGSRMLIGLVGAGKSPLEQPNIQTKLANQAQAAALYDAGGVKYTVGVSSVYTNMRY